jgi:hypothetical protein
VSDRLQAGYGSESLRYAMACVSILYTVAALCYLRAARLLRVEARVPQTEPKAGGRCGT